MASLTVDEGTGARSFELPIRGPLEGAPYLSPGSLRIEAADGQRPSAVVASFLPTEVEFNLRLPQLVAHAPMPLDGASLSLAAAQAQPVVHFEMATEGLAVLGPLPADLAGLEAYVHQQPGLLAWHRYRIAGVGFQGSEGEG